ncbi:Alpha/beta hydrolase domain-containing protein, putative lipase [Tenacibaculum litopenaei]
METKASGKEIVKKSNSISMRKLRLLLLCVTVWTQVTVSWSQSKLAGSYGVSPDYQAFLEAIHAYQGPPIHELPLAIGRKAMEDMQFEENTAYEHELHYEHTTAVYQKDSAKIVVIKPKKLRRKKLPVLVYFHGGGWVFNSFKTHKRLLSTIARKAKVAVVFVDYSRAPEASYPKANEEGVTVLRWIYQKGRSYGLDKKRVFVGGDSAGGNMATAVAITVKKDPELTLQGQLLLYPVTSDNLQTQSYQLYSKGHYLSRATMQWFWEQYAPDKATRSLPTVCPLKADLTTLKGLPRALVITAEFDVLRDEGEAYAKHLRKAGVPVVATRYSGVIHDFIVLNPLKETPEARAAVAQICSFLEQSPEKK